MLVVVLGLVVVRRRVVVFGRVCLLLMIVLFVFVAAAALVVRVRGVIMLFLGGVLVTMFVPLLFGMGVVLRTPVGRTLEETKTVF